jgi:hypothetical protein
MTTVPAAQPADTHVLYWTALLSILVLPIIILVANYLLDSDPMDEVLKRSGPDLCLIGLGASGSVFLDAKVAAAYALPPQLLLMVIMGIILILRGACSRILGRTKSSTAPGGGGGPSATQPGWAGWSVGLGTASVFLVFGVLTYGYFK